MSLPVQLTVRGTLVPTTLEAARVLHNDTAGSPQGIAAARALGDLSHTVWSPYQGGAPSGATAGELLFLDVWCDAPSIGQFFSNPITQEQAARMFKAKDATVWMRADGAYAFHLPAPRAAERRFVGMIRAPIIAPAEAIAIFARADAARVRDGRKLGLISHDVFVKIPMPGDTTGPEVLGIDVWSDAAGMATHYADATHAQAVGAAFAGKPAVSVWEQAPGSWSEW